MVKTGRLRELLNEHGVEWIDDSYAQFLCTVWPGQDGKQWRMLERKGSEYTELKTWYATPEQAIAATLGPGTCHIEHYDTDVLLGEDYYRCTACHSEIFYNLGYRFCPNCGRKVIN